MDKKSAGTIGLIAAILFCGLPGLCGLCFGPLFALIGTIPGSEIDIFGSSEPGSAIGLGIGILCMSVIFMAIPAAVWFFVLRDKPASDEGIEYDEPIPDEDM